VNPKSAKNQKLIKQYPFIAAVLATPMEPFGMRFYPSDNFRARSQVDDLTIRVEKADGDLMYRRAHNVGLGESSCIFQFKGNRDEQVMRRGEYLFAIDYNGEIINHVDWPRNAEEQRELDGEVYGWTVFWTGRTRFANGSLGYTDPVWDKVQYLVWATVDAWHDDTRDDDAPDGRFGEFRDRSIRLTVYSEPEQGFKQLHEDASVYTNLLLDSDVMMRGVIKKDHDIVSISGMIYEMCVTFQDEVYFNGMKDVLDNGEVRGASGQLGSVQVLCAEMCGYDRVMLQDDASWVTFQLRPGSKHMYVLGQNGTLPQIRNLVRTAVRTWNNKPKARAAFRPDEEVSVV
jgi:hypothetical protein